MRKPLFAVLLALLFALALGAVVAVSSIGEEEKPVKPVGSAAVALDVPASDSPAGGSETSGLGEAAPLPAMARKPEPPPVEPAPEPPVEDFPEEPVVPEPEIEAPPVPVAPPPPPPPPEPPPVEFDDEG